MKREIAGAYVEISDFTSKVPALAKSLVGGRGGFAYALVSLHCLLVYSVESYNHALGLLGDMPHILGEISFELGDIPDHSMLTNAFDRFSTHRMVLNKT